MAALCPRGLDTNHLFAGNPIASQHHLRYRSIIKRQQWDVPAIRGMEYDQYDNPAAVYLVWRDADNVVRGSSRLSPTTRPYMLKEVFPAFVTEIDLPQSDQVYEGSRFCVDETLPPELRLKIIQEIVLGYLEFGLLYDLQKIIGMMYPIYWRNIFVRAGWEPNYVGEVLKLESGMRAQAGWVEVSETALRRVREVTGIWDSVLSLGRGHDSMDRKLAA